MNYYDVFWDALILLAVIAITIVLFLGLARYFLRGMEDEKLQTYIDFLKWVVVSVALVMIVNVVDTIFKDREAGLNELKQYDKYVDMVIKEDAIGKKWRLAQYYSNVTASATLRSRWVDYFKVIDKEYNDSLGVHKRLLEINDSLQYVALKHPLDTNRSVERSIDLIQLRLNSLNYELDTKVNTPGNNNTSPDFLEKQGFAYLLSKNVNMAIATFTNLESAYPTYHNAYEIKKLLLDNKAELQADKTDAWAKVYNIIIDKYSWKVDADILAQMKAAMNN